MRILAAVISLLLVGQADAESFGLPGLADEPVRARIVTDTRTIVPGGTITAGVLLTLAEGWHVYWRHPGDAGLATSVALELPAGFEVGPLQWPVPTRFTEPGDIQTNGYADQVLLFVDVTAPDDLPPGTTVTIGITAKWLMCKDVCIPGSAEIGIALPVTTERTAAEDELIATWRARLPEPAESAGASDASVRDVSVTTDRSESGELAFDVDVRWRRPVWRVDWIVAQPAGLEVIDVVETSRGSKTTLRCRVRRLKGQELSAESVETLIVAYDDPPAHRSRDESDTLEPKRRAIALDLPLDDLRVAGDGGNTNE